MLKATTDSEIAVLGGTVYPSHTVNITFSLPGLVVQVSK